MERGQWDKHAYKVERGQWDKHAYKVERGQWDKHALSKITVRKIGKGKYCGWHIDGNERFLLGDFTVTHNTRNMLGKDAAEPRYTRTRPKWWWNYVFKKEDVQLLDIITDEGDECEPVTFLPIIPLHLINGTSGIGTGHSTFIPNHNPLDICAWITAKIKGDYLPIILPWYRDFKGQIKLVDRNKESKSDDETNNKTNNESDNILEKDNVEVNKNTRYTMVTIGNFEIIGNKRKKITITELPVGRSMHNYDKWLTKIREEKKISGYSNYCTHDKVLFEITGMKNPSFRNLKLTRSYGMSNMVLLDMNNRPIKYNSVKDILESFYCLRMPYYQKRKDNIISNIQGRIDLLNNKIKFIIALINGYNLVKKKPEVTVREAAEQNCILSMGLSKKEIIPQMEKMGFPGDLLKKVTLYSCTLEELDNSKKELNKMNNEKESVGKISPEQMWQNDINEFVKAYCKEYKCKYSPSKGLSLNIMK
uniref:DNA topoisomerase (ATP-hydrolyzing) n=1 Tax=Pithovirus LCPAC302 TaxID=2506593 RepID=A0A481Z6V6_9VIRU|nr:MAG: DNA topoisomerase II [Pithovirus LCPAC302]